MPCVKTAISMDKELFEELESLADELNLPRSRLITLALEEYLRRRENHLLLEQLNTVYDDAPDASEQTLLRAMSQPHRQMVEDGW